jgi:hypothetical protein
MMNCNLQWANVCAEVLVAPWRRRSRALSFHRKAAYLIRRTQKAGATLSAPFGSMPAVDISLRMAKNGVVMGLVSRRLRRKQAFFGAFLALKGVDFSSLTEILPDFCRRGLHPIFGDVMVKSA